MDDGYGADNCDSSNLKVIGITGGVGAGKSEVLSIIKDNCNCKIIIADELAKTLEQKGGLCYEPLCELLGEKVLNEEEKIDPAKMAQMIFSDGNLLLQVDEIIHPTVKNEILRIIDETALEGVCDYLFIEAALLIEDGYDLICDELWYVYASEEIRRKRLKDSRGYSDEKITSIMESQLDEDIFRKYCSVVIDNDGDTKATKAQIIELLNSAKK